MNISKTDLLLLNKIKFGAKDTNGTVEVPTEETEASSEKGMNALMFQGMNNLMSNPNLAQRVGVNNLSFQGKLVNTKTAGIAAAALLGALALTSCNPDPDVITQETNVNVQVDQEMATKMQQMLEELQALRRDYNNGNRELLAKIDALTSILNSMLATLNTLADNDNVTRQQIQTLIGLVQNLITAVQNNNLNDQEFKTQILANQQAIITLLKAQGADTSKALAILQEILNSNASLAEKLDMIAGLLGDIKSMFALTLNYMERAEKDRADLLNYAKQTAINTSVLVDYAQKAYESDSIQILNQEKILNKLNIINVDMNSNLENLSKQLGVSQSTIISMLQKIGYSMEQINNMSAGDIINALKENTSAVKNVNAQLSAILAQLQSGQISADEAAAKILEALNLINDKLDAILFQITDLNNKFSQYAKDSKNYWNTVIKNQQLNTQAIQDGWKGEAARDDAMIQKYNEILNALLSLKQSIGNNDDVIKAIKENTELLRLLNLDVNTNASEINAAINNLTTKVLPYLINNTEDNKTIISLLGKLEPYSHDNSGITPEDLQAIINAINNNGDKITNVINENDAATQAKIDKVISILEKLDGKFNQILDKLDGMSGLNLDEIVNLLKENNTLARALQEEMKLDFALANNYLAEMLKNSTAISAKVDKMAGDADTIIKILNELKANSNNGNGITKEELEYILKQYGDDMFAKYKNLLTTFHAEDIEKLDAIIQLLQQDLQGDVELFNKIKIWMESTDFTIKANLEILQKIFEYLPNLVCNCQCGDGDHNNDEGIRNNINNLLNM